MKALSIAILLALSAGFLPPTPRSGAVPTGTLAGFAERTNIPYAEGKLVLDALRPELWPAELRGLTPAQLENVWPEWVARRDAEIRARVAEGDEDSIITFLLFGVTFTQQPRYSFAALAGGSASQGRTEDVVAANPIVQTRIRDMVAGIARPGTNERLQFARHVVERKGIDPATPAGRAATEQFLRESLRRLLAEYDDAWRESTLRSTLFRDRGLSSDTSIYSAFSIDQALADLKANEMIEPGSIRRVAVIGPGLDFADKQDGYDFYPLQTIQPFAVIESLLRLHLATPDALQVATYDLNPRINEHVARARERAQGGDAYVVHLPRDAAQQWHPRLVAFWERFGEVIGESAQPVTPPAELPAVQVRAVTIHSNIVRSIVAQDANIVLQRPDPLPDAERFDIVIATKEMSR